MNPWINTTSISVYSSQVEKATLKVMDMTGEVLLTRPLDLIPGENTLQLSKEELSAIGVLYYELEVADMVIMKKMVLLK